MKLFWRKDNKANKKTAIDLPVKEVLTGLSLVLDTKGQVLDISQELKFLLAKTKLKLPSPLSALLVSTFPEITLPIDQWPNQLELVLLGQEPRSLYMLGALFYQAPDWRMVLIDNTALVVRLSQEKLRRNLLDFTALKSTYLSTASNASLQGLSEEWLEGLMLRLQCPWMCLFTRQLRQWQPFAKVALPGEDANSGIIEDVQDILFNLYPKKNAPIRLLIGLNETPVVLLPYAEKDGVHLWLVMRDVRGRDVRDESILYGLEYSVWMIILHLFSSPLSAALRNNSMQHTFERNAYLQKILASGWWEYYPEQQKVYMDTSLADILGVALSDDGSVGFEAAMQAIDPLDEPEFRNRLFRAASENTKFSMVLRIQVSGQSSWYRMMAELAEGVGDKRRLLGYAMNIDDLRQMETAVSEAQARLEGLIYNAPAIVYILGYKNEGFHLEFCSASVESMLGWTSDQLQAMPLGEFVHPDDREDYYRGLRDLLRVSSISRRYRVIDKNNTYHWILDESKLLRDERGLPKEVVGLSIDVTEATESAELVRKSEERYRIIVEDAPAIICRYLPDLTIVYGNQQLWLSLGFDSDNEAHLNINLGDFLSSEDRQELLLRNAQFTPEKPGGNTEILLKLSDNVHAWWMWSDRALFDNEGNIVEIQCVGRDNTEVQNARQQIYQSSKMATLGEMATGLAHEISQPLTVMHMALTNIVKRFNSSNTIDPKYLLDKLKRLESQVSRVSKVVEHMRIFGRNSEIEGTLFDPIVAIQEAVFLVQDGLEKDSVPVEIKQQLMPLPKIKGHSDRFEQVLINLLINAQYESIRHFKSMGRPAWVHISSIVENDIIYITVEDSGGGIPRDLLERIFEPFVTTKPVGKGTGLGLSVSYGIINLMGGKLTATNGANGARFTIAFPVASDAASVS